MAWHSSPSGILFTLEAQGRMSYYGVGGYPTCVFDGGPRVVGGSSGTYSQFIDMYDSRRNVPGPLTVEFLANSYEGDHASVKVKVKLEQALQGEGNLCYVVLWEDKVVRDKTYRFVERRMAAYEILTISKANEEQVIKRTFTLDGGWNKANLGVSAWVQNFAGREIMNGNATKLVEGVGVEPTSLGRVKALFN